MLKLFLLLFVSSQAFAKDFDFDFDNVPSVEPIVVPNYNPNAVYNPEIRKESVPEYKKGTKSYRDICGYPNLEGKITNGEETLPHELPWMVGMFMDEAYFCGGTLISEEWVLTAAHCVDGFYNWTLNIGAHRIRDEEEDGRVIQVSYYTVPHFDWKPLLIKNDIALVRLVEPVTFNDKIRPSCLPRRSQADETFASLTGTASGWGKPADNVTSISEVLRKVSNPIMTNEDCYKIYQDVIQPTNICMKTVGGGSTCSGDSGGPLAIMEENGQYTQVGVTSFGVSFGCEVDAPAGFTRVTSYLDWIETITGIMIDP